jgi:flagellin-specific chaperone FliS
MEEVQALVHITNLIEDKGVEKCTLKTQEAYEILKELAHKLETEYVIYRP